MAALASEEDEGQAEKITLGVEIKLPSETLRFFGNDELRARTFYEKYALRDEQGRVVEKVPPDMWRRVAREISSVEQSEDSGKQWYDRFLWLLWDWRFIPGGRILFGAGQPRRSTLLNCYFFPIREDSIESIFDFCKEAARTYSFGGGVGTDISVLRPKGAPVNNSAVYSTGSVSFMELLSTTTGTIGQAGRRGALMITIRVDHPDVLDFIHAKRDLTRVNYANISVKLSDGFMKAVEMDEEFHLYFKNEKADVTKVVRAKEVWRQLIQSAWQSAEPGIIFWGHVKEGSPTEYNGMEVNGVNPCSEQALEDYGCCCLGSINLSAFVLDEFMASARIDWENLEKAVQHAVRFLDNVLDYNEAKHPLPQQQEASLRSRRIGLGFTALADMLISLGMRYDEEETVRFTEDLFRRLKNAAYSASSDLAVEKGCFAAYDREKHLSMPFMQKLGQNLREKIQRQGLRNACILTIPPVGSGSILAGTTSGIEPIFALSYTRRSKSLSSGEFRVYHPLVREYMKRTNSTEESSLPPYFVTSHMIKPEMRVRMQAAIQRHIDSSISSTVNLPQEASADDVGAIYFLAWKLGCKGITVYREGSREGILLTADAAKQKPVEHSSTRFERPKLLTGETVKFVLPEGSLYVTVNRNHEGVKEVFVNLGKSGENEKAYTEALGRLISLYLQQGGRVEEAVKTLKGIHGKQVVWREGMELYSIPDAVAKALEVVSGMKVLEPAKWGKCFECGQESMVYENGCFTCKTCGYTKCG